MRTLEEYVAARSARGGFYRAVREAYEGALRGDLVLVDPSPPRGFASYLARLDYSLWYWTALVLSALTLALVFLDAPALSVARYVLGSLFVLYLPGYAVVEALYPSGSELSPLERLALSLGLSLAVVPLLGLLLNYTPWGIRLAPVAVTLFAFTVIVSTVAAYRKYIVVKLEAELAKTKNKIRGKS